MSKRDRLVDALTWLVEFEDGKGEEPTACVKKEKALNLRIVEYQCLRAWIADQNLRKDVPDLPTATAPFFKNKRGNRSWFVTDDIMVIENIEGREVAIRAFARADQGWEELDHVEAVNFPIFQIHGRENKWLPGNIAGYLRHEHTAEVLDITEEIKRIKQQIRQGISDRSYVAYINCDTNSIEEQTHWEQLGDAELQDVIARDSDSAERVDAEWSETMVLRIFETMDPDGTGWATQPFQFLPEDIARVQYGNGRTHIVTGHRTVLESLLWLGGKKDKKGNKKVGMISDPRFTSADRSVLFEFLSASWDAYFARKEAASEVEKSVAPDALMPPVEAYEEEAYC